MGVVSWLEIDEKSSIAEVGWDGHEKKSKIGLVELMWLLRENAIWVYKSQDVK